MVIPPIVKLLVLPALLTYAMRPEAVLAVGLGKLKFNPAFDAVILKVVATSTVAVLAPITPLVVRVSGMAVNRVDEALVKVEPKAILTFELKVFP